MHQSILTAPSPSLPPGYCGAFACLVSPGGGAFANFVLPGGPGHLPTSGPFPSFWHARGLLSKYNYTEDFSGKESRLFHPSRKKLKRVVKVCSWFYACISSPLIKPELHSEIWSYRRESTFFGYWIKFLLISFEKHPFIFIKLFITYNLTALKSPHPREFAIQGKKTIGNAQGSAGGGGVLCAAGIDWCINRDLRSTKNSKRTTGNLSPPTNNGKLVSLFS